MVGFGFTDRPPEAVYGKDLWVEHLDNLMAALGIEQFDIIGNSFGGGLALAYSIRFPEKVRRLVLMGSVGISFPLTDGLDAVWGYQPSIANMKRLLNIFAYDDTIVTDELAELRYRASIRPGVQESYANMFSTPRQNGIESLASPEEAIAGLRHEALIIHGREDKVIPPDNALRLFSLLTNAQLHMFGRCGHWTQIEHADRFNCLVSDFLG
jgi:2-hydroxymuconate-semialdehyde hydrolase